MTSSKTENIKHVKVNFTTKILLLTIDDLSTLETKKELCFARVESIFERSGFSFNDIESLNNVYKNYKWGSNADRTYRKNAIKKAINNFGSNPYKYLFNNAI